MDDRNRLGEMLVRRMEELGTNANQLALATGFRPASISNWIHGKRRPSAASITALARALAMDADEMLDIAGHRPRYRADIEPERADIHEMVDRLPPAELALVRDYLTWRMREAKLTPVRPALRRRPRSGD